MRQLSIYVVEQIVLWRDQLRYISLLGSSNGKLKKAKMLPQAITPYLTFEGFNYLLKMKSDTRHFSTIEIGKYFNFSEGTRIDPFLITASLQSKGLAVGSGISAM